MAKLCRKVCGEVCCDSPAVWMCFSSILPMLRVVSRFPNRFKNSASFSFSLAFGDGFRTSSQRSNAFVAKLPTGAIRSFRPLPRTRRIPAERSQSLRLSPTSSATRRPAEYMVSRIARSGPPDRCWRVGPAGGHSPVQSSESAAACDQRGEF